MQTKILKVNNTKPQISAIRQAARLIQKGEIVAFPTETVYGLGADALNPLAVKKVFEAKGRPADNPLIIHIHDKKDLKKLARDMPKITEKITEKFWPGPLTIVLKKSKTVPKITTGGLDTVAIRMPKNKIASLLIKESGVPLAAPSANFFGRPSPTLAKHVSEDLSGRISMILDGGKTRIGIESTVIDLTSKTPMLLRPGGVTLEQIEEIIGTIRIHPIIKGRKSKIMHRSPGMKYKHYSPNAKIILIEGTDRNVDKKILQLISKFKKQKKRIGIMVMQKNHAYKADMVRFVGNSPDKIAANLFKAFREFDEGKIDIILAHGISREGLGLGIMNRLGKAAHMKIKV
ncbi:L-threonylcarbamoyladenylate synthase [Candidatus Nitrosotenuis sp. DW1]|uniref:L-threonylcarbamoyladenylate synthase n=1 Tax=Candidatus Nitrosotenuis sp. DW1 TaxID=2259672 RepID=UPI0015C812D2|nr:L-threonylcarbamoyladenylate synthase [Candidatus Nitrosotenuis sp. DW1]QLH08223.1 threonylcarbamoyl-AMP synthase [Candidatus Nitrosotenuis sp. DW1]